MGWWGPRSALGHWDSWEMGRVAQCCGPTTLALLQVEADELLDTPAVLELSGAAAG